MSETPLTNAVAESSADEPQTPRRGMLIQVVTGFLSFIIVTIPATLGGIFFLDPRLRGKKAAGSGDLDGFIKLKVTSDTIPEDGTPIAVSVITDQEDAWNLYRDVPVGSIWLRKNSDGAVVVFNSVCPHLGCRVGYRPSEKDFFCPCHTSVFDLDGEKTNDVPPRGMDTLEVLTATDGVPADNGQELWVRFENFRRGTAEKIAV